MPSTLESQDKFIDRRNPDSDGSAPARERRQFVGSYDDLSPEGRELGRAVDDYKLEHRRRFVTYDEILGVIKRIGYRK